jgi:2,4-dienoyl-CoA reductase-like NADH-dependent reductase (Old Yellow Enzyme family)/thioredoxin reductase
MSPNFDFGNLLKPGNIGTMTIRNRMVMPPMATGFHSPEGYPTDRTLDHYRVRAEGGVGVIIIEATSIDSIEGRGFRRQLVIDDDKFIPALSELAEVIHESGAKTAVQLHHVGPSGTSRVTGRQIVAPSAVAYLGGETPRALEVGEIQRLAERFAQGARRAKQAGFDGVEIHGAHGYLLSAFLSAFSNRRDDRYGGDAERRARFILEVISAIRQEVGRDFPVWIRVGGDVAEEYARMIELAGADAIHVSIPVPGPANPGTPAMGEAPGALIPVAAAVKKIVSVPVIVVNRISPEIAEEAISTGKTDFVSFGRPVLADPQYAKKIASGDLDDIKPCIRCNICLNSIVRSEGIHCTVNPALGREREYAITKASGSKKVTVIGGGPAGMEAARVAAVRGHKVSLYEKAGELGGQLVLAQVAPHKEPVTDLVRYLERQMRAQGVEVHLGTEGTAEVIGKNSPDAVVVAVGASPFRPDIPGIDRENVVLAWDVLGGRAKVGQKVVVIGGELVACEVAEMLASAGKQVTLTTLEDGLLTFGAYPQRGALIYRLCEEHKVPVFSVAKYKEITGRGLALVDKEGKRQTLEADTVVIAAGTHPNIGPAHDLKTMVPEVYSAGDCVQTRGILEAMRDGYLAGLSV